jgi:hypothetical protein
MSEAIASDSMPEHAPRLLKGETSQAFLTTTVFHAAEKISFIRNEDFNPARLRDLLSVKPFFWHKGYSTNTNLKDVGFNTDFSKYT